MPVAEVATTCLSWEMRAEFQSSMNQDLRFAVESPGQDMAWISQNITQPGAGETFGSNTDGAHLESS